MLVLLAAPDATLPQELGQNVLILDGPLPSTSHLEQIVRETFNAAKLSEPERPVIVRAVDALIGLAAFPAEQALAISLVKRRQPNRTRRKKQKSQLALTVVNANNVPFRHQRCVPPIELRSMRTQGSKIGQVRKSAAAANCSGLT